MKLEGHINIARNFTVGIFVRISGSSLWHSFSTVTQVTQFISVEYSYIRHFLNLVVERSTTVNTFQLKS